MNPGTVPRRVSKTVEQSRESQCLNTMKRSEERHHEASAQEAKQHYDSRREWRKTLSDIKKDITNN